MLAHANPQHEAAKGCRKISSKHVFKWKEPAAGYRRARLNNHIKLQLQLGFRDSGLCQFLQPLLLDVARYSFARSSCRASAAL